MARQWGVTPWGLDAELQEDARRDLWVERWRAFSLAEAERLVPPRQPPQPGFKRIT